MTAVPVASADFPRIQKRSPSDAAFHTGRTAPWLPCLARSGCSIREAAAMNGPGRSDEPIRASAPPSSGSAGPLLAAGTTAEQRYDLPDQPMNGEMDPFFFLARHKNLIPHEYPCRTSFIAERRAGGRSRWANGRPRRQGTGCPSARPGSTCRVSGSARRCSAPGRAARILAAAADAPACGSALAGSGAVRERPEAGWLAHYARNLEAAGEFETGLLAGVNEVRIWFDDLAERDARYYFQLDYLDGPAAELCAAARRWGSDIAAG